MTKDRTSDARTDLYTFGASRFAAPDFDVLAQASDISSPVLASLWTAALSPERDRDNCAIATALADGVTAVDLADLYIPTIAHQLGDMWCADTLGFAEVTIGVARLQAMLRDLGPEWTADETARADAPLVLLISPANDQHTLGCVLIAGQLRRLGYSVRMALDCTYEDLNRFIHHLNFDAIFISASQSESLEKLRKMVDFLRAAFEVPPPIAVGGGILDVHDKVASLLGVETATTNIDEAIQTCGLTYTQNNRAASAPKV